jgi:hypothetical protein
MTKKLEQFLALRQGESSVMQYLGQFHHLSQYAPERVNTDAKKKEHFMRGLNAKLQKIMIVCPNVTFHEAVNIAISYEEKTHEHKEDKKNKSASARPSGGNQKRQRVIYHPVNHYRPPYHPPQFQPR